MANHFAQDGRKSSQNGYAGRRFKTQQAPQGSPRAQKAAAAGQRFQQPAYNAPKKRRGPVIAGIIAAVLLILVVAGGVAGFKLLGEVKAVKADAEAVIASAEQMKESLKSGDGDSLFATSVDIQNRADSMHQTTQGFLWNAAALVPVYGSDVKSVQTIAASLDTLSESVISPLASSMQGVSLSSLMSDDGTINVEILTKLADTLVASKDTVNQVADEIAALPEAHIDQLKTALGKAQPLVAKLNEGVNVASEIAPYLPQMLGAGGQTRNYIIVAQQNSEIRATGGFPGSMGSLSITDGKISLGDFHSVSSFTKEYQTQTSENEMAMFGDASNRPVQTITTNPDFSATGLHIRDLWAANIGTPADGVIAMDPVFLQHLLALTGGVTLSDGSVIDGSNAGRTLLHDVYNTKPVAIQDVFFAEAAGAAAKKVMGSLGSASMTDLLKTVKQDAEAGRFMVWMANADEEAVMAKLGFDGSVSQDTTKPVLGVYVNDNTWAKMSWYLSISTEVGTETANADGSKSYQVTTYFKNNATQDAVRGDARYITGYNPDLKGLGNMIFEAYLFSPAGGSISDVQCSTGEVFGATSYGNVQTYRTGTQIQLAPQQESVVTYTVTTSPDAQDALKVRTTPTAQEVAGW